MEMQEILNAITTVGFPIVMCGVLAWYVKHTTDKFTDMVNKITEQHNGETKNMIQSLDANTQAIALLSDRLKRDVDG